MQVDAAVLMFTVLGLEIGNECPERLAFLGHDVGEKETSRRPSRAHVASPSSLLLSFRYWFGLARPSQWVVLSDDHPAAGWALFGRRKAHDARAGRPPVAKLVDAPVDRAGVTRRSVRRRIRARLALPSRTRESAGDGEACRRETSVLGSFSARVRVAGFIASRA